jgi:hypothetical protein
MYEKLFVFVDNYVIINVYNLIDRIVFIQWITPEYIGIVENNIFKYILINSILDLKPIDNNKLEYLNNMVNEIPTMKRLRLKLPITQEVSLNELLEKYHGLTKLRIIYHDFFKGFIGFSSENLNIKTELDYYESFKQFLISKILVYKKIDLSELLTYYFTINVLAEITKKYIELVIKSKLDINITYISNLLNDLYKKY